MKILVTDRDPGQWEIEGENGISIGEAIIEANELPKDNRVQPFAICGLDCSCRTCHVLVDEEWFEKLEPKEDDEANLLATSMNEQKNSRLSCQVIMNESLDGIKVQLHEDW
jgi:2Fe-2S ferredoxin